MTRSTGRSSRPGLRVALFFLATLCAIAGVIRVVHDYSARAEPKPELLLFFLASAAVLLGESVTKLKFGGMEVERVAELEDKVEELAEVARRETGKDMAAPAHTPTRASASAAPNDVATARPADVATAQEDRNAGTDATPQPSVAPSFDARVEAIARKIYTRPLTWSDDPVAELRGQSEAGGNALTAIVLPSANYPNSFRVVVMLFLSGSTSLASGNRVAFFLHHTFPDRVRIVPAEGRKISLTLISAGTFTIGTLLTDGTILTLDLSHADLSALSPQQRSTFIHT